MDGGEADGMDGNGRSDRPFHWVDEMDGGRGMDRHTDPVPSEYSRVWTIGIFLCNNL
jgi:hypothetical protein